MKFAIVDSFPDIKNAETELIIRFKSAAKLLGHTCDIIDTDGYYLGTSINIRDRIEEYSFVLINHFISPKLIDIFTYTFMWNPVSFLLEWGYKSTTTNILSCDDFLAYDSEIILGHLRSMLTPQKRYSKNFISFVPSCFGELKKRSIGDIKKPTIFYCGINWEKVGKRRGRHHELFKALDKIGIMKFYGPQKIHGVRPWADYVSYQGDIPFDGLSVIDRITDSGIALILSSDAHRDSHAPTNRLYEACAAGAIIISDNNPFVQKYFGNSVLYVDYSHDFKEMEKVVVNHYNWIINNRKEAEELAMRAQAIYASFFTIEGQLKVLIDIHENRKQLVHTFESPIKIYNSSIIVLLKENQLLAEKTLASIKNLNLFGQKVELLISYCNEKDKDLSKKLLAQSLFDVKFYHNSENFSKGAQIRNLHSHVSDMSEYLFFIEEGQTFFRDHLRIHLNLFEKMPNIQALTSPFIQPIYSEKKKHTEYHFHPCNFSVSFQNIFDFEFMIPACSFSAKKDFFENLPHWPIDSSNFFLFSFFATKAFLANTLTSAQNPTAYLNHDEVVNVQSKEFKYKFELTCLFESFRYDHNKLVIEYMNEYATQGWYKKVGKKIVKKLKKYLIFRWILNVLKMIYQRLSRFV